MVYLICLPFAIFEAGAFTAIGMWLLHLVETGFSPEVATTFVLERWYVPALSGAVAGPAIAYNYTRMSPEQDSVTALLMALIIVVLTVVYTAVFLFGHWMLAGGTFDVLRDNLLLILGSSLFVAIPSYFVLGGYIFASAFRGIGRGMRFK